MLKVRDCIQRMPEYQHPALAPPGNLRLDMNENTLGCSPRILARLRSLDTVTLALYPSRERAEKLMADFLRIRPAQLLLSNGADESIDVLCRAYLDRGNQLVTVVPAFGMYEVFARAAGAEVVCVPAGWDYSFPLKGILEAASPRTRIVVITNPNNPTGIPVPGAQILQVAQAAPHAAILVDEAYFDFHRETMIDCLEKVPNLFVVRTLSKAYGLAGMRLGVLAGPAAQIAMLRRICTPFNISAFAAECLAEALADQDYVNDCVNRVVATREWFRRELSLLGFKSWPSQANFVLVNFGRLKDAILVGMGVAGIALRDRPDCEGCLRISIGTKAEMARVIAALDSILASPAELQEAAE